MLLRIHAVRLANDDGTQKANITPQEVSQWVGRANDVFSGANVRFMFTEDRAGPDWTDLNSTIVNNICGDGDANWLEARSQADFLAASYPGKIVVFFRGGSHYQNTCLGGGFSWHDLNFVAMPGFPDTGGCGVQNINLFPHELGHYLGLSHTFGPTFKNVTAAQEYFASKSNDPSVFDGDGLADTPPDPSIESIACTTDTSVTLNNITLNFSRSNIMSYWHPVGTPDLSDMQKKIVRETARARLLEVGGYVSIKPTFFWSSSGPDEPGECETGDNPVKATVRIVNPSQRTILIDYRGIPDSRDGTSLTLGKIPDLAIGPRTSKTLVLEVTLETPPLEQETFRTARAVFDIYEPDTTGKFALIASPSINITTGIQASDLCKFQRPVISPSIGLVTAIPGTVGQEDSELVVTAEVDSSINIESLAATLVGPDPSDQVVANAELLPLFGTSEEGLWLGSFEFPDDAQDGLYVVKVALPLQGTESVSNTVILDRAAPVVTGSVSPLPNAVGWNNTPVSITWEADDSGGSDFVRCSALERVPDSPSEYSGPDGHSISLEGHCMDLAGNIGSGTVVINYDATAPEISSSQHGKLFVLDPLASIPVDVLCTDATSGITSCESSAQSLDTGSLGKHTYRVLATDTAGNAASRSVAYTVVSSLEDALCMNPTVIGTSGDDVIHGTSGNDVIDAKGGNDTVFGGPGNDIICGGLGNDRLFGNSGQDQISGDDGDDFVVGGRDNDLLYGEIGNDSIFGWSGDDRLAGGNGNDSLYGAGGNDSISGDEGTDQLSGWTGDDTLVGSDGVANNDSLRGGEGQDGCSGDPDIESGCEDDL